MKSEQEKPNVDLTSLPLSQDQDPCTFYYAHFHPIPDPVFSISRSPPPPHGISLASLKISYICWHRGHFNFKVNFFGVYFTLSFWALCHWLFYTLTQRFSSPALTYSVLTWWSSGCSVAWSAPSSLLGLKSHVTCSEHPTPTHSLFYTQLFFLALLPETIYVPWLWSLTLEYKVQRSNPT